MRYALPRPKSPLGSSGHALHIGDGLEESVTVGIGGNLTRPQCDEAPAVGTLPRLQEPRQRRGKGPRRSGAKDDLPASRIEADDHRVMPYGSAPPTEVLKHHNRPPGAKFSGQDLKSGGMT